MDPEFDGVLEGDEFVVDGGMAPEPFDAVFSAMPILIGLFALMFVTVVVLMVVTVTRKARRYREAGIDPLTADVERDIRVLQALENRRLQPAPATPPGTRPVEQRLDDVERLYLSGKISSVERDAARAKLLGSI